jgi:LmbE family N-acetylglucosaminyl deacetylase
MERVMASDALAIAQMRRILIVAPHPDDETLGCGGLISLASETGSEFYIVFVTDGAGSHRNSLAWPPARLAAQREKEASLALACLGIASAQRHFLRLPDANMPAPGTPTWQRAVEVLREILESFSPDLVILPWRRDPHCDHRASWVLAQHALDQTDLSPEVLEYAIWLEELGSPEDRPSADEAELVGFYVGDVLANKRAAVAAHLSQTTDLIADDPTGFRLTPKTIARLTQPTEIYVRSIR